MPLRLFLMCLVMAVGTSLAAFAPLFIPLSPKRVGIISTYATGLLVGAALSIIIPEGVAAVYGSREEGGHHGEHSGEEEHSHGLEGYIGVALLSGFILMYLIHAFQPHEHEAATKGSYAQHRHRASVYRASSELEPLSTSSSISTMMDVPSREGSPNPPGFDWERSSTPGAYDQSAEGPVSSPRPRGSAPPSPRRYESTKHAPNPNHDHGGSGGTFSAVLGLLVHSLADGISLGASSISSSQASSSSSLDFIIFFAIILHKAPTAFALASLLISSSAPGPYIRRSLLAFSLATPVGALITYFLLRLVGVSDHTEGTGFYTGLALVFSGGTFLFVATHVMENKGDGELHEHASETKKAALVVAGMMTPGILSRLVGHGH